MFSLYLVIIERNTFIRYLLFLSEETLGCSGLHNTVLRGIFCTTVDTITLYLDAIATIIIIAKPV